MVSGKDKSITLDAPQGATAYTRCNNCELWILAALLFGYAAMSFFLWGSFETHFDNPGYTDPAASYVAGRGFTSGCWYLQSCDEFWAGNVPLHQFLLIAWFKIFGFSSASVQALNLVYIVLGMGFLWFGMRRSRLIATAGLRLGAIAFFLVSDSSLSLAVSGRPEPLCLLIACMAWFALSLKTTVLRWGLLLACGVLAPWAGLALAAFFAFCGVGTFIFYPKQYWREVLALGFGGIIGTILLFVFYKEMGVLEAFLSNIGPHMTVSFSGNEVSTMSYVKKLSWRVGGFLNQSSLLTAFLSVWICVICFVKGNSRRLAVLDVGCLLGLPLLFSAAGVFPRYYGFFWLLPMVVLLFALLSTGVMRGRNCSFVFNCFLWLSVMTPGAYAWASVVQGWPSLRSNRHERMASFANDVIHPDDVAWVDTRLWYFTKPIAKKTFSGLWGLQASTSKNRDEISVVVFPSEVRGGPSYWSNLPGTWRPTGQQLQVPDYHKFIRSNRDTPPILFEVYRRKL